MNAARRLTSNHCGRCARSISASPRLSNLRVKNKSSDGSSGFLARSPVGDSFRIPLSTNGAYRVTQHFFDALGRETNTVVSVGSTPGEATSATRYPYGGSDYSISTDVRGAETVRRVDLIANGEETCEAIFTNGVEVSRTKSRSVFGGASSTRREWGMPVGQAGACENWTEQTRLSDYDAFGRRIEYAITASSDYGVVTNSVSTYDFLGRVVSTATPLGTTAYEYDGASLRISQSVFTAGDVRRMTAYLYNERGELVGTTTDGVTSRSDVAYETDASNIAWRVTTSVKMTGSVTNSVRTTKTQLNGLSDDLRSRQTETSASGRTTQTETRFDSETQTLTTTAQTEDQTPVVLTSKFGLQLRETSLEGVAEYAYDALGRVASETQLNAQGEVLRHVPKEYSSADDLVREVVDYVEDGVGVWTTEYDWLGRATAEENALGEVVCIESDALGRTVAKRGDTYPLRFCYDTQGRKTNGLTTRDDGATWDETRWEFDAGSGLNTAKVFADGSRIAYAYAADGKETLLVAATLGTNSFGYAYDTIGNRLTATANSLTNVYFANNLNQYTSILCGSAALRETKTPTYDADGNLTSDASFSCAYDAENRLVSVLPLSPTNGSFAIENRYDHCHRRTQKVVSQFVNGEWSAYSTHTYVWDGNNICPVL